MNKKLTLFGRWILSPAFLLCFLAVHAQKAPLRDMQESVKLRSILLPDSKKGWHHFSTGIELDLKDPGQFFKQHAEAFELLNGYGMTLIRHTREDALNMDHFKFQQTYNGIPISGAEYILHQRKLDKGNRVKGNGTVVRGFARNATPAISGDAALKTALAQVNAKQYAWQSPQHEAMVRSMKKDDKATLYPQPKLVYYSVSDNPADASSYQLAYEIDVFALEPLSRKKFYVNAENGSVIRSIDQIHEVNAPATGTTLYNGVQNIITDFTGTQYVLKETNRAGTGTAISTYDMNNSENYSMAVNYQNSGTTWQNEPVGVQGHWGAEKSFDYYHNVYGLNSFDNNGAEIIAYMDYGVNYNNASWNGLYLTFGSGDGVNRTSWSSLDIVGHELTHAVTEHSAGLVYLNESGALNESFSDIFGNMVEFSVEANDSDWLVSEDITSNGLGIRSMANPNLFSHPDTWHGTYWYSSSGDFGGVHINSGVQNHWFYLLAHGGSGTNDNGDSYSVTGIGRVTAAAITYRSLTQYLTPTSNYHDAREGALEAAEDLYGRTSAEYAQTALAWYAVGVGYPAYSTQDLSLRTVTILGSSCNQLSLELVNLSTAATIPSGALVNVVVTENGLPKPPEQIVLPSALAPGNSIMMPLSQVISSAASIVNLNAQINYAPDPEPGNNIATARLFRGIITVGGINPDFSNVAAAATAVQDPNITICGHLIFKIRNGTYDGEVRITNVTASSSQHTITFESESGNPDDVIIYSLIPINSSYGTITIENSNYIRIRNVTAVRELSGAAFVSSGLSLRGTLQDILIEGNKFKNPGAGTFRSNLDFWAFGQLQRAITIRNNTFEQANYGINNSSPMTMTEHISIENNRFIDHQSAIRSLQAGSSLTIRGNTITSAIINIYCIGASASSQLRIEGNDIRISGTTPIGINAFDRSSSTVMIINNMISIKSSGNSTGILCNTMARAEILHNTIRQEKITSGASPATSLTLLSDLTQKIVLNNIFFNTVSGAMGISLLAGSQDEINHNAFHIPNGSIGRRNNMVFQTLPQWRAGTGYDLNSIAVQPTFVSDVDLHLTAQQLNLKNGKVTAVQNDFDGNQRSIPPYMGADEYFFTPDVGVIGVRLTTSAAPCQGVHVQIDVQNFLTVDAFPHGTRIPVSYTVNNGDPVRDTLTLQQDLLPGQMVTYTFTPFFFFAGTSSITARTNYPGDQNPSNDAFTSSVTARIVITVGGRNGDFATLQEAIDFLSDQSVFCDQVIILDMYPGTFPPVTIDDFAALPETASVVIQSQTRNKADVIISSDKASTITLNGTKRVTFRDLTIQYRGDSESAAAITMRNTCENITIENCNLVMSSPRNGHYLINMQSVDKSAPSQINSLHLYNNFFDQGGISLFDDLSFESGSNKIEIIGNTFQGFYGDAVVMRHTSNLTVSGNTISSGNLSGGIRISQAGDKINIDQNRISLTNGTDGISIDADKSSLATISMINNFIDLRRGEAPVTGVSISGASGSVLHNTVRLAPGSDSFPFEAIVLKNFSSNLNIRSNIFYSTVADASGIVIAQVDNTTQDFNDIYIPNGNTGVDVDSDSKIYKTLADWQKNMGFDLNSTDVEPVFAAETDLHLAFDQPALRPKDVPEPYIETDIDGEQRSFPPCIGADEFTGKSNSYSGKENSLYLAVYPNPVEGKVMILEGKVATSGSYGISIFDAYGVLQGKQQLYLESEDLKTEVSVYELSPGIYLLRLTDPTGKAWTIRFEKK